MDKKYLTVTALTKYIKVKLEGDAHLQNVLVQGEISNFTHHTRGHMYFTLKDEHASIRAVMFQSYNRQLRFKPEDGMKVFVQGKINVFEPFGQYQLYVTDMQPDGIGALHLAYEQLKEKLAQAGYFAEEHKKPIPAFPEKIALITSPTGAAVRDMITTIKRRYPIVEIVVIPTIVQGETAPDSIIRSIRIANQHPFDTIILARGGGSIEDLWCFNDERVAKAIFASKIPIISGVGHETDVTISDFVADLRAPTPTGAAELAVPSLLEVTSQVHHLTERLKKLSRISLMNKYEQLQRLTTAKAFYQPEQLLFQKVQYVDHVTERMHMLVKTAYQEKREQFKESLNRLEKLHPERKIALVKQQVTYLTKQLSKTTVNHYENKVKHFNHLVETLTLLNPLHIMRRGFAIPYDAENKLIYSAKDVSKDDRITVRFADGKVMCNVEEVELNNEQ